MKLLSIDPGYERVGIAVIEHTEGTTDTLLYSTCFKTSTSIAFNQRLKSIGEEVEKIIKKYKPRALAIEKLYFSNNHKTVMGVSEARGVIIYCCSHLGLNIFEYTPSQIKVAITGYGKANKNMIMSMVPKLIKMKKVTNSDDELDAIAIGLTCLAYEKLSIKNSDNTK